MMVTNTSIDPFDIAEQKLYSKTPIPTQPSPKISTTPQVTPSQQPTQKEIVQSEINPPISSTSPKQQSNDPFDLAEQKIQQDVQKDESFWKQTYDMIFSPEESPLEYGLGQTIRGMGTAIAGTPGDIVQFGKAVGSLLPEPPKELTENINKLFPLNTSAKKYIGDIAGSQELKEMFDVATENKYKPTTPTEEFLQETSGDIATALIGSRRFLRPIMAAIGSNLTKQGIKELGFEPDTQEKGKLASIVFLSTFNPRGARQYATNLYENARRLNPRNATIGGSDFIYGLDRLENRLNQGIRSAPTKAPLFPIIRDLRTNILPNGQIPVNSLLQAKIDLNRIRDNLIYSPEIRGRPARRALRANLNETAYVIDNAINRYGRQNPQFLNLYRRANTAWGGIEQSTRFSDYLRRHMKGIALTSSLGTFITAMTHPSSLIPIASGAIIGGTLLKGGELAHRIIMNPELRRFYTNVISNALRENAPAMIRNLKALDKELQKSEPSESP